MNVIAAWANDADKAQLDYVIQNLQALNLTESSDNKRRNKGDELPNVVQQCLKTAQNGLPQSGDDLPKFVILCQNCLRILEVCHSVPSQQFFVLAYNTVRRFLSAKAHHAAFDEAKRLHWRLIKTYGDPKRMTPKENGALVPTEIANIAVGTVLSLTISWAEGGGGHEAEEFGYVLLAAEKLKTWFRFVDNEADAQRFLQSLFKGLSRGLITLAAKKDWERLSSTCLMMLRSSECATISQVFHSLGRALTLVPESYAIRLSLSCLETPVLLTVVHSSLRGDCLSSSSIETQHGRTKESLLDILQSAVPVAATFRRLIAIKIPVESTDGASILKALGGLHGSSRIRKALEASALIISSGFGLSLQASTCQVDEECVFRLNSHTVAVALVTAAKILGAERARTEISLKSGKSGNDLKSDESVEKDSFEAALSTSLGWQWSDCMSRSPCLMSVKELTWVSSHMRAIAIHLLESNIVSHWALNMFRYSAMAALTAIESSDCGPKELHVHQSKAVLTDCLRGLTLACQRVQDQWKDVLHVLDGLLKILLSIYVGSVETKADILRELMENVVAQRIHIFLSQDGRPSQIQPLQAATRHNIATEAASQADSNVTTRRRRTRKTPAATDVIVPSFSAVQVLKSDKLRVPDDALQEVIRAEISTIARMSKEVDSDSMKQCCTHDMSLVLGTLLKYLLQELYPASKAPIQHAQILLLLYSLDLGKDGSWNCASSSSHSVLHGALDLLQTCEDSSTEAYLLNGIILSISVFERAERLVDDSLLEQRKLQQMLNQKLREKPSDAADAAADGTTLWSMDARQSPISTAMNVESWNNLQEEIERVSDAIRAATDLYVSLCSQEKAKRRKYAALLCHLAREIGVLAGFQGIVGAEQKALEAHGHLLRELQPASGSDILGCQRIVDSRPFEGSILAHCILPRVSETTSLEAVLNAETDLAENCGRRGMNLIERAKLNMEASIIYAYMGEQSENALHYASEAHRLLSPGSMDGNAACPEVFKPRALLALAHSTDARPESIVNAVGWWYLAVWYIRSLILLGRLFERGGMSHEAIKAFQEGDRMSTALGCPLLHMVNSLHISSITLQSGREEAVESILSSLSTMLLRLENDRPCLMDSLPMTWCRSFAKILRGNIYFTKGLNVDAFTCCSEALGLLGEPFAAAENNDGSLAFFAFLLAEAQVLKILITGRRCDSSDSTEMKSEIVECIRSMDVGGNICSVGRLKLLLSMLDQQGNPSMRNLPTCKKAKPIEARIWAPGQFTEDDYEFISNEDLSQNAAHDEEIPKPRSARKNRSSAIDQAPSSKDSERKVRFRAIPRLLCTPTLWKALIESKNAPHLLRLVSQRLSPACAAGGYLHLAALLLHAAMGSTLQLQHRLIMHTRLQHAQRRQRNSSTSSDDALQSSRAEEALHILNAGFDWSLVEELAEGSISWTSDETPRSQEGLGKVTEVLMALDRKAEDALSRWMSLLPIGTTAVAISSTAMPGRNAIVVCRLHPTLLAPLMLEIPVSAIDPDRFIHPIHSLRLDDAEESSKDGHRMLRSSEYMGEPAWSSCSSLTVSTAVASVLEEMDRILKSSARSMKDLATDTKEQQREWWRARVDIDDRLSYLLRHVDSSWLGPWKCAMIGVPDCSFEAVDLIEKSRNLLGRIEEEVDDGRQGDDAIKSHTAWEAATIHNVLLHAATTVVNGSALMSTHDLLQAVKTLMALVVEEKDERERIGRYVIDALTSEAAKDNSKKALRTCKLEEAGHESFAKLSLKENTVMTTVERARDAVYDGTRQVTFLLNGGDADDNEPQCERHRRRERDSSAPPRNQIAESDSPARTITRSQAVENTPARLGIQTSIQPSPAAPSTRRAASRRKRLPAKEDFASLSKGQNLTKAFEKLTVEESDASERTKENMQKRVYEENSPPPTARPSPSHVERTPAPTSTVLRTGNGRTVKKHTSRLKMLATPGPTSALKNRTVSTALRFDASYGTTVKPTPKPSHRAVAATAPRLRPLRDTPGVAKTVPILERERTEDSSSKFLANQAPVVAVFDAALQFLPWESVPGLTGQKLYRLPSLTCAVAARANQAINDADVGLQNAWIDPYSAYYALNPSGDLAATQETFESWFANIDGWEGKAGTAPQSGELISALQRKSLFVYCGHGGGEQYIPLPRLRALPRCSATLLMGCSSGRLRGGPGDGRSWTYYEPSGVVLAYVLAGCPAAVANLWDVTDKDIDRFAQAVLTEWLANSSSNKLDPLASDSSARDVAASVAAARRACKLPYLIGASPVCYGIPTAIKKATQ